MREWQPLYYDPRTMTAVRHPSDRLGLSVPHGVCDVGRAHLYEALTPIEFYLNRCPLHRDYQQNP